MWNVFKQIVRTGILTESAPTAEGGEGLEAGEAGEAGAGSDHPAAARIQAELLGILGRALAIRQVDAGSCNGCELEIQALGNPYYNLEGLGIRFVASPRHADLLLVTGPVSRHMAEALRRTWEATPEPRLVVAVGDCGAGCGEDGANGGGNAGPGGIFGTGYASCGRVANVIPVDAVVRGCPPPPIEILRVLLAVVGRAQRPAGL